MKLGVVCLSAVVVLGGCDLELTENETTTPQIDPQFDQVTLMSAGDETVCALRANGSIACNRIAFPEGEVFNQVAAGRDMGCAIRLDGSTSCWTADFDERPPPYHNIAQVDAGRDHFCALTRDYEIECWDDRGDDAWDPQGKFEMVSVGFDTFCGLRRTGEIECWELDGSSVESPPQTDFVSVSVGGSHACGIRALGQLECWGDNTFGQATVPTGLFKQVSAGGSYTCALKETNIARCWGGDAPAREFASVVQITTGDNRSEFRPFAPGPVCVLHDDGYPTCWMWNGNSWAAHPGPYGGLGSACFDDNDCSTGRCGQGDNERYCAAECTDRCPNGYNCVPADGLDIRVCWPTDG